jgi:hypothetical protein
MGIKQVLSAPAPPWQRAYVERMMGSIRRECLGSRDRVQRTQPSIPLQAFRSYHHKSRTHLALQKDTPEPRPIQPPDVGRILSSPQVGGLHHRYERRAA